MRWTEEKLKSWNDKQTEIAKERTKSRVEIKNNDVPIDRHRHATNNGLRVQILSEEDEQVILANYLNLKNLRWAHPPNGGKRSIGVAKKLKAAGVSPGLPDCLIFEKPPMFPKSNGVVIELKRTKGGTLSAAQKEWLEHLESQGWCCKVAKGALDAIKFLQEIGF